MKKWFPIVCSVALCTGIGLFVAEEIAKRVADRPLTGPLFRHDRTLGHKNRNNQQTSQCYDGVRTSIYTNAAGYRVKSPNEPEKKGAKVLFLGDSFTFGMGVSAEEVFVSLLEEKANKELGAFQFINTGVGGWGTQHEVAFYETLGAKEGAKFVVLTIGPNDAQDNTPLSLYEPSGSDQVAEGIQLAKNGVPTPVAGRLQKLANIFPLYEFLASHSHFFALIRYAAAGGNPFAGRVEAAKPVDPSKETPGVPPLFDAAADRNTKLLLKRLARLTKENGAELFVTNTGIFYAYGPTAPFLESAPGWFKENGIDYVDVSTEISDPAGNDRLVFKSDGHYNAHGNQRLANALWPHLAQRLKKGSNPF